MTDPAAASSLVELPLEECLALLRAGKVGRAGVVVNEFPIVLPVNYRLVETLGLTWIAIRTRPGASLDRATNGVAFEIDSIDPTRHEGWSVVVRGTLHHADADAAGMRERFDTNPWLAERDAWLLIEPFSISGRRLHAPATEWAFHPDAYL